MFVSFRLSPGDLSLLVFTDGSSRIVGGFDSSEPEKFLRALLYSFRCPGSPVSRTVVEGVLLSVPVAVVIDVESVYDGFETKFASRSFA